MKALRVLSLSALCTATMLAEDVSLPPITVEAEYESVPSLMSEEPLDEKITITDEGIDKFSPPAQSSVYDSMDLIPGFTVDNQDPYGLAPTQAYDRGMSSNFMDMTLNGVPIYSVRPIGPRDNVFDMENISSIDYYRGAFNPSVAPGVGTKGGLIDLHWKKPTQESSATFSGSAGKYDFQRFFGRIDTGKVDGMGAFASLSQTNASKWKGPGDLGPKVNFAAGATGDFGDNHLSLFYNHTQQNRYDFKGLSYAQTQDLRKNYYDDYQDNNASADNYYQYWKESMRYDDIQLAYDTSCVGGQCNMTLYGSSGYETSDEGNGIGTVDNKRTGLIAAANFSPGEFEFGGGLWGELAWLEKYVEKVSTTPQRNHQGWKWLNKNHGATSILSPYITASYNPDNLKVEVSLRYLYYREAANTLYDNNNSYSNYQQAVDNGTVVSGGDVGAITYQHFLPSVGLSYAFDSGTELFAKYGRAYQRPYRYSFAAQYAANKGGIRTKLLAQGMTLEDVMKSWKMEISDLFDIGVRNVTEYSEIGLTLFYNLHHNLLYDVYDPGVQINYLQNIGEATVWGGLSCKAVLNP